VVTLPRSSKNLPDEKIESMLKLKKAFSENLTVIGPDNKLRIYEDIHSLIQDFVEFRLSIYPIRYAAWIKRDEAKLDYARSKLEFISDVVNNRIVLKGKTRKQLSDELKKKFNVDYIQKFISLPVYVFCTDEIRTLEKEIESLEKDIERWKNSVPEKDYLRELNIK
jgi:DNA topoisomerase-2